MERCHTFISVTSVPGKTRVDGNIPLACHKGHKRRGTKSESSGAGITGGMRANASTCTDGEEKVLNRPWHKMMVITAYRIMLTRSLMDLYNGNTYAYK